MDISDKVQVPVLEDIIVQGNKVTAAESTWDANEMALLNQQIEAIVQAQMQIAVEKAVQEMKNYIDEILPELIEQALNAEDENN